MSVCQITLPVCAEKKLQHFLELLWASPPIVPGTRDAFARMAFASEWRPSGAAKYSAAVEKRDASASRCNSPRSTRAPEPSSRADQRLLRRHRLTRGSELRATVRDGKRLRTANLDLRVVSTAGTVSRIGFVVPKHGHSSVDRNRLKRRMRELARLRILDVVRGNALPATDVVMRAQPGAYRLDFDQLRGEIEILRARLLRLVREPSGEGRAGEAGRTSGA